MGKKKTIREIVKQQETTDMAALSMQERILLSMELSEFCLSLQRSIKQRRSHNAF